MGASAFVVVPTDCIGDGTPELVQAACGAFERMLLAGDLTNASQLAETLANVVARPREEGRGRLVN